MLTTVCRQEQFNAAHRLFNSNWSDEENKAYYGLCANPNYHGHNYKLIVKVTGEVNPETGYLIDMKEIKEMVRKHVIEPFDHRNLNLDVPEFRNLIPSAENIASVIWKKLRPDLDPSYDLSIVLYETERNFIEYHGK